MSDKVQWIEPFDSTVEEMLDQISNDSQVRGKIRGVMLHLTKVDLAIMDTYKAEIAKLKAELDLSQQRVKHWRKELDEALDGIEREREKVAKLKEALKARCHCEDLARHGSSGPCTVCKALLGGSEGEAK